VTATDEAIAAESVELLSQLIRNQCVNDGDADSGFESRSADAIAQFLGGAGLDLERYTARPGRESLVARIEGTDPKAPTLLFMGHTDVVPANADGWRRDPFGAELIDDELWGRGAVDMLNLTATMAVAFRDLARSGFRPRGTLVYLAVADEENLGTWGAEHLLREERDAVMADYVVTEAGGFQIPSAAGPRLPVIVGEKGSYWCRIAVRGTPGHASQPFRTDNALVTAAEVVQRLAEYRPPTMIHDTWRRFVEGVDFGPEWNARLTDADTLYDFCNELPIGLAREAHACTHTTFAPTIAHGGTKTNVIPDLVEIEVDIRTLPGQKASDIRKMLDDALGDLAAHLEITPFDENESTASPTDTPMWDAMQKVSSDLVAGSSLVPFLTVGATDARFFRRAGSVAYGFGLFSRKLSFEDYAAMFHGNDERVDVESLVLSTRLWDALSRELLA
jgi:acetylornithine deacetylase/succinyl-diaminopimelate desuccinylase-like protein